MLGTVLAVTSFMVGLFQSTLPAAMQILGDTIITAVVAGSILISAFITFGLNTVVHSVIFLFMSPVGVLSMLAMFWLALSKKPQFS